ncbi:[FeFe] hydrogenase H-cluster radical SAM maturase HydE [Heliorestis acidaminivorans]|uniref:[FeFe] hydrogenase H-cluster radical SAM maturase HydE n=1 Tax=Heliorestis acidaminivorans TaxID=553427 RepID=A0A6I0ES66_9FIRM|nr:[FeFe] hydrogenase H-cluster radical SAM maturase HydE [Heliorestis acidaminivorans]KAB2953340.1 [FeFe] hydrogenase H-cluster radical SAM maturase HydE [Heliorestis acidaminivorans]
MSLLNKYLTATSDERWLLIFPSMQQTLQAQQQMEQAGLQGDFIPTPKGYGPVCTTAIVFSGLLAPEVKELMSLQSLIPTYLEPWRRRPAGPAWHEALESIKTTAYGDALLRCRDQQDWTVEEVTYLLSPPTVEDEEALRLSAEALRQETLGDVVDVRGAVEFGNICRKDCHYCGLRKSNIQLTRYRLDLEKTMQAIEDIYNMGIRTVILQSGEEQENETASIIKMIEAIKERFKLRITLSLGERSLADYKAFRQAGANNYLLRIETTDHELFSKVHPDDDLEERMQHLLWLREAGFLLGTGGLVGLPGQKVASLAQDILYWRQLGANMIGIGPFLPAAGTPLANQPAGDLAITLRVYAVTRLLCGRVFIPSTTALASLHPDGQRLGLQWGANSIMLTHTPEEVRSHYHLYKNKAKVDLDFACRSILEAKREIPAYLNWPTRK